MRLYHFSEEPNIARFEPRIAPTQSDARPLVWAIDAEHSPLYYFPRDCPRVAFWELPETTPTDRERFLGLSDVTMVLTIESGWLEQMRQTTLYRYVMPPETFAPVDIDTDSFYGAYNSDAGVTPLSVEPVGELLGALRDAQVELRITPSLWPLRDALLSSSLHFSMIRMRNAAPQRETKIL